MKKILMITAVAIAALIVIGIVKNLVIKVAVEKGVELVTGLKLNIGSFRVGVLNGVVDIRNMKLYNPKGFKDPVMMDMPRIYVSYSLPDIMNGKMHLYKVRLELKELTVVKDASGRLNLDSLKPAQTGKLRAAGQEKEPAGKTPEIFIDLFELKIGRALYKDYSRPLAPSIREFDVNIDERYTNVDNPYTVVSLIVVRTLSNTAIANLAKFDMRGLQDNIIGVREATAKAVETASTAAKQTHEVVKRAAGDTAKKTQEAVAELAGMFKNPFGDQEKR